MKISIQLLSIVFAVSLIGCKEQSKSKEAVSEVETVKAEEKGTVPASWIDKRVERAKTRLEKSDAGKVIWNAMQAHGGLAKWYGQGALAFRFNYQPLDGGTQRDSYQTIDTWSNRARHTSAKDSTAHFGWTGETAWVKAKDSTAFAYDTRFWALTPFYFLAQPFVLDGAGVNLELLPQKTYNDTLQDVVKVTFDSGTGDAPDDYYVLYFTEGTHRLSAIRYIVSYPAYFKKGEHLPEKFMEVIGEKEINGIVFPTNYKTHWLTDEEQPGEHITNIDVSGIRFVGRVPDTFFDTPEDAKIIEGL